MSNELMTNSYGFKEPQAPQTQGLAHAQASKAVQEIQAALTIAAARPRNNAAAFQRIMEACDRPFLAESAIYTYPKGKTTVTGPSIRLAEVLAQNWGNLSVGIREISQSDGVSEVEAFAWDLETNFQETKIFHVSHVRHTKQGSYKVTDPREIYEMVANNGARRLRACILSVIPGDIVDAAVDRCQKTMSSGKEPIGERIKKLISAFNEVGVKVEHIEKRLGHNMDATVEAEMVVLRGIYKSLKDGMAKREDFFEIGGVASEGQATESMKDLLANKSKPNTAKTTPLPPEPVDNTVKEFFDEETGEVIPA